MEYHLETPIGEEETRKLRVGDVFYITGTIITARDEAHLKALELHEKGENTSIDFKGKGIFHCGPIMRKVDGEWTVVAAGPTTSARMENFQDSFIKAFKPSTIIGKGGMGDRTSEACQKYGCIYGAFTGGAALLAARGIKKVKDVFWLDELGMPECLWVYEVKNFGPMIVTIDTHGGNLTKQVGDKVQERLENILEEA
jgi:fumarate hydratase subunit beta